MTDEAHRDVARSLSERSETKGYAPVGFQVLGLDGIPEVRPGDDLPSMIVAAYTALAPEDGDILVVTSKVVSKAEGRILPGEDREAAIDRETVREVARVDWNGGSTRIVENRQGLVLAAAGVDASNVDDGFVLLLPEDPDASALAIASAVRDATGRRVGVIVSDTLGRAWRIGQTDHAIGAAGVLVADDLRGTTDSRGRVLEATVDAFGDEFASAADLVKGKAAGRPVAVIRGLGHLVRDLDAPGARTLQRPAREDLFRRGAAEAWREGYEAALTVPPAGDWVVVVPVRGPGGKTRLGADDELSAAIAADTLAAAEATGARVIVESRPIGLREAIRLALAEIGDGVHRAVLLGDLPALSPGELRHALALAGTAARAFTPDADGTGTVLATARPGMPLEPLFGEDSAALHRAAGFTELHLPDDWGLRRDVDTIEHLRALAAGGRLGPRTTARLR